MKRSISITISLLLVTASSSTAEPGFSFTVTADMREVHAAFGDVCQAINANHGGPGVFHVTVGDMDPTAPNRAVVDTYFGSSAIWYPIIGNHELPGQGNESYYGENMDWLRAEYHNGNGVRTPLKDYTNQDGPASSLETTYSWDYGDAHFVVLNIYWDGSSDTATDGDVVPALYDWLAADLAANTKPFVFVFGHEPAFPYHRHVGDSLDQYPANRDAFWSLLEAEGVQVFFCSHTHLFSKHQGDQDHIGEVWQLDVGNAGNDSTTDPPYEGQTYFHVAVEQDHVIVNVYRDEGTGTFTWADSVTPACGGDEHCDDYNPCTDDTCVDQACVFTPNDASSCDDGLYCTGVETCVGGSCEATGDPCQSDELCDEDADTCIPLTQTVYDFTGITSPSSTHSAEDGEIDVDESMIEGGTFPARRGSGISGWDLWGEASTAEYAVLVGSDDNRYQGAFAGLGDNAAMIFESLIAEDPASIAQIEVSVEVGRGDSRRLGWVYIWNYNTGSYLVLGTQSGAEDQVVATNITSNPGDYVEAGTGQLTVFVVNEFSAAWICVDDISVTISVPSGCQGDEDCDDGVSCTDDTCVAGACVFTPNDANCDDTLYCNGAESCDALLDCQAGTSIDCDDSVGCTDDSCNEGTDSCDNVPNDGLCDNGLYCDGEEICDAVLDCQAGTSINCKDGVACTVDSCNEETDLCDNVPDDAFCDDGLWCTGDHICDPDLNCVSDGWPPCKDGVKCTLDNCDEDTHTCDNVPVDALCDDGLWCTGVETCDAQFSCLVDVPPCSDGVSCTVDNCDEGSHECDNAPDDTLCDDGVFCNGAEWCDAVSDCQPGSDPCLAGQSCDEGGGQCFGAEGVLSCRDHAAAGRLCLDLGTNGGIDPRAGGIDELEIEVTDASGFTGGVTVICVYAGEMSASVSGTSVNGNTVTVSFSPALPDEDACTIELDCGGSVCVRGLEGDLNLSGETNTVDASQLRIRFGQDAATAGPQWDFNVSGLVTTMDYSQVKVRFGNMAPECP